MEGRMYSNIQNSLQVPALIKPCEAHYWGCKGCCFCPRFTLFCQGIASRNMQSVQSSCSTLVIGVSWGCSNSSTSAFLLLPIAFSTLTHAANLPWSHWVCWTHSDPCGVIEKKFGWGGRNSAEGPTQRDGNVIKWWCGEFLFSGISLFRVLLPSWNKCSCFTSQFKDVRLKISNAVVCSCSSFPVSAKRVPFLLPLVRNFCKEVVNKRQVFMKKLTGKENTKLRGLRAWFWSNSPL